MTVRRNPHREKEKMVFEEFLRAAPSIAQDAQSQSPSDEEPYDIISRSVNGLPVKWQITEWLHPEQTQRSKERYRLTRAIDNAVLGLQMPDSITCGLIRREPPAHFKPKHTKPFREGLLGLARDAVAEWTKPLPHQRYTWPKENECWVLPSDIAAWPVLAKYLCKVVIERSQTPRVFVAGISASFSRENAVDQLMYRIEKKMRAYHWSTGEDVRLLVFYDEGWIHNSPAFDPLIDNAEIAARKLRGTAVPFKRIYLIFGRSGEAYDIHPDFKRCT